MMRLSHRLFRSSNVLDPDRSTSLGGGATRKEDDKVSSMVVHDTSGP
jgi:hypothetical protein